MRAHQIKPGMKIRVNGSECKVTRVRKRGGDMVEVECHDSNYGGSRTHVFNHAQPVQSA